MAYRYCWHGLHRRDYLEKDIHLARAFAVDTHDCCYANYSIVQEC